MKKLTPLACILCGALAATASLSRAADPSPTSRPSSTSLSGTVKSYNYGPRGNIEGLLLDSGGKLTQINLPREMEDAISHNVALGDSIKTTVTQDIGPPPPRPQPRRGPNPQNGPQDNPPMNDAPNAGPEAAPPPPPPPADNAQPDHPVVRLLSLTDAKGKEYQQPSPEDRKAVHIEATIKALNYDPRGMTNGAQLDNGDLVHIAPPEAKLLQLAVGQKLTIDGIAQPTDSGTQSIDAHTVNGILVKSPGPQPGPGGPRGGPQRGPRGNAQNTPPGAPPQ